MSGMLKAGLIGLLVGGVFGLGITLATPCCTPCTAILVGMSAGFLACLWDRPASGGSGAALGAQSGAIAGVGQLIGQVLGTVLNSLAVSPEEAAQAVAELAQLFGLDVDIPAMDPAMYWVNQIVFTGGCAITNLVIAAGLGAVGGLLWYQFMGKNQVQPAPVEPEI
jgi:hypothetical protein